MDWMRTLVNRCAAIVRGRKLDEDLNEELRAHIDLAFEEYRRRGMSTEAARTAALRDFGGVTQAREAYRSQRGVPFIETLARDLRFAARQLVKSPGFAATAILTLALGIGANTAMFSVVQGVLLAPLPYGEPDRLVILWQGRPNVKHIDVSYPDFRDWQRSARSFDGMAAFAFRHFNLASPGEPESLAGMQVTAGFFATLGVKPALGRELSPSEDSPNGPQAAMISDRLWKDRFASSPRVLGQPVSIEGVEYTVVGVLPQGFRFWGDGDIYTSLARGAPKIMMERTVHGIGGIARVRPGLSFATARGELNAVQQNLDRLYPAEDRSIDADIVPLKQEMVGDVRPTLMLLLYAVGLVLLIACANIANLLLARSAARRREFGVRAALGASRARIVRQLLTESVLLSLAGGVLGLIFAEGAVGLVVNSVRDTLPRSENIGVNVPVLLFTFGVVILVGILFGLGPALKSSRMDVQSSLKDGGRGSTGVRHHAQSALVIVQMALTLVLLVGSGLLLRTIRDLLQQNPGFEARQLISFRIGLSSSLTQTAPGTRTAFQQLLERIRHIPGVEGAELTNIVPLNGNDNSGPFWLGTAEPASPQDAPHALYFWTGPDYLETMKIPLLQGRFFTASDASQTDKVIAIDSDLARIYFPGKNPVGQTITVAHWGTARVVGVVGHVRHWGLDDPTSYNPGQIYIPVYQLPDSMVLDFFRDSLVIVVRTPLNLATVMPAIKGVVYGAAADQTIFDVRPIEEIISASMAPQRLPMMLLASFAVLALALASVGIYGVISYSVSQRVQEIGIRMALGANPRNVLRMVIGRGLRMAIAGLAIGVAAALILARILASFSSLLYGVRANDPLTFLAVSLVLTAAATLACYIPARRAMRIDPVQALRTE
jgi:predicted permease